MNKENGVNSKQLNVGASVIDTLISQGIDEKQAVSMAPPLVKFVDKILVELRKNMSSDLDQRTEDLATKADLKVLGADLKNNMSDLKNNMSDFKLDLIASNKTQFMWTAGMLLALAGIMVGLDVFS